MALILLIRHGMTDAVGRQLVGWTPGVHLNAEGRGEARRLGEFLRPSPIAAVYASPLERTAETAREVAQPHGLAVNVRERLGEVRYGDWTGRMLEEVEADPRWHFWNERRGEARCPNGESMAEIQDRMAAELRDIARRHADETVAVVSHGDPIRAAMSYFLGMPLDMVLRLQIDTASVSTIQFDPPWITVSGLNERGWLRLPA